jgi:rhodanese-related sulfurtransferase
MLATMRKKLLVGALLAAIVAAPVFAGWFDPTWPSTRKLIVMRFSAAKQITTADFAAWMADAQKQKPIILDTRAAEEFAVSHLTGATLATNEKDAKQALQNVSKTAPIVVYCSVGYRSSAIAVALQKSGYTNVQNMDGGIFTWANEGRVLVRGDGDAMRADKVHPYDSTWGKLLDEKYRSKKL